jgi:hypothetical protein
MGTFGQFIKAMFWHGGRRWVATAVPPVILTAVQFGFSTFAWPLPLKLEFLRNIQWWTWGLATLFGLLVASYLTWREQYLLNKELVGRPDVTVVCQYCDSLSSGVMARGAPEFQFILKNPGEHTAVNISAVEIVVPIPDAVIKGWEKGTLSFPGGGPWHPSEKPKYWNARFQSIDRLAARNMDGEKSLEYRIENFGHLNRCISSVLGQIAAEDGSSALQLVLVFSNLGKPLRTWHAHYELRYSLLKEHELIAVFQGYGEVPAKGRACSIEGCNAGEPLKIGDSV